MLPPRLLVAATLLGAAQAFNNASPFFILSSKPLPHTKLESAQIATAENVEAGVNSVLEACSVDNYLFVHQPELPSTLLQQSADAMPFISKRMSGVDGESTSVQISSVVGALDLDKTVERSRWCKDIPIVVATSGLAALEKGEKAARDGLTTLDNTFESHIKDWEAKQKSWMVILTSSPPARSKRPARTGEEDTHLYEMDEPYPSVLHQDLKRAAPERAARMSRRQEEGGNVNSDLPLFEKYQFLTPGIFMGGVVVILLVSILYIGVSAISGLEVSYMAFSKEMGPQAQKPKQG